MRRALILLAALLLWVGSGCDLGIQDLIDEQENENGGGAAVSTAGPEPPYEAERPFSASTDCKFCHPRQYQEWRTSPHSYSGISPTFYSLVAAGQNSFGAGVLVNGGDNPGTAQAGGVAAFCLPCHSPMAFMGLEGRYSGNNAGKTDVEPIYPFVCNLASGDLALEPCTTQNSEEDCGAPGRCASFEGRTCVNMPPAQAGVDFPRKLVHCMDDSDCAAGTNSCPAGEDCGPCMIAPTTIYYDAVAQEGINCEVCHNAMPNHQRACQLFRNSDSAAVLSLDIEEREASNGQRLRLGPYPVEGSGPGSMPAPDEGGPNDHLLPVLNAFHESARVDTPLVVSYDLTDRAYDLSGTLIGTPDPSRLKPTALTCEELPYCRAEICEGGPMIGDECLNDFDCGGCGGRLCGGDSPRAGLACLTSHDCGVPGSLTQNILERAVDDGTLGPLARRDLPGGFEIDRTDANWFRSSYMCAACHDVRPPFGNSALRSCQLQDTHVCSTDADCQGLNIGCPGEDCGPCVVENSSSPQIPGTASHGMPAAGHERGTGVRRVENLFTEWQISLYNHPELTFCQGNSFRACTMDADCGVDGPCDVSSPFNEVVTCQDCHMSLFPRIPLIHDANLDGTPDTVTPKNLLYASDKAAIEGSQTNILQPLPIRRVSTHFMPGVDLPLVKFSGQGTQEQLRQELLDAAYKLTVDTREATANVNGTLHVELTVENVGVGHRLPAGFSHERQNWVQLYVQTEASLAAFGGDPFHPNAPCNMQGTIATGADQGETAMGEDDYIDMTGAIDLGNAGCVYRSGFILDKGHPETGELEADGSMDDEDPEDFFVVVGTRVRGLPTDPRIEVLPGAQGRALDIQFICEEATAEAYLEGIRDGTGIGMGTNSEPAEHQVMYCDPNLSPHIPGEGTQLGGEAADEGSGPGRHMGFTAPGFGNPGCMESGEDLGPCVPEIELSDGNERGSCAKDLTRTSCQRNADCGDAGPCLYACSEFVELACCDVGDDPDEPTDDQIQCRDFYAEIGAHECVIGFEGTAPTMSMCIGGPDSGKPCTPNDSAAPADPDQPSIPLDSDDCAEGHLCGDVGECVVENRGIVNFQNQFRQTFNGVCVDRRPVFARTAAGVPIPLLDGDDRPIECLLNLSCTLQDARAPDNQVGVCLINGQCAEDEDDKLMTDPEPDTGFGTRPLSSHGDPCTNVTYREDCGLNDVGDTIACNVERSVELNGRPSESVFIQNHPFNFNSLPPLQPRTFEYAFKVPTYLGLTASDRLIVAARVMNRHFPMRFLRNLIGTQVIRPPFIMEGQGDSSDPTQCQDPRTIDIDCFVKPVVLLGNAEVGGYVPPTQQVRTKTVTVVIP